MRFVALSAFAVFALVGCETDPAKPIAASEDGLTGTVDGSGRADGVLRPDGRASDQGTTPDGVGPQPGTWTAPAEGNAWRALFNYRGRMSDNENDNELWVMEPYGQGKESITDLSGLKDLEPPLSCNYGCVVSPDLVWLGVVTAPPSAKGFSFKIGKFNEALEVKLLKGAELKDKVDFKFAGTRLYYSQEATCSGASCQYDVFMIDLAENVNQPVKILTFPPGYDLEGSTYKGHFKVSPDGSRLVLLNTTIRSVGIYMWREGQGLVELDFICKFGSKGNCSGTGSEYSDKDPVAISPDGRWIVFFTFSERWQRIRLYDADAPQQITLTVVASVPVGSYVEHACDPANLADWQWRRVILDPVFTPDGQEIVFATLTDCPIKDEVACPARRVCPPKKPRTNLRRVRLATLQAGGALEEADVFDVTGNPFGDVTDNRQVTGYALSPDGATIVFTATPTYDQSERFLKDGSSRQRNDREVYRVRLDGTALEQLTNDLSWSAESPRVAPPAP